MFSSLQTPLVISWINRLGRIITLIVVVIAEAALDIVVAVAMVIVEVALDIVVAVAMVIVEVAFVTVIARDSSVSMGIHRAINSVL